jgi:hypothetical protein
MPQTLPAPVDDHPRPSCFDQAPPVAKQKRTFKILHCEPVFNSVLKNNEPLQWFGNAKPLVNEIAAPFVHETCLYAVFEHEAMDRSL